MVTVADPVLHPICYCTYVFDTCLSVMYTRLSCTHVCHVHMSVMYTRLSYLLGLCRVFVLCVLVGVTERLLTAVPSPSAGLALGYYTHFTSPIRRYADLVVRTLNYTCTHTHTLMTPPMTPPHCRFTECCWPQLLKAATQTAVSFLVLKPWTGCAHTSTRRTSPPSLLSQRLPSCSRHCISWGGSRGHPALWRELLWR